MRIEIDLMYTSHCKNNIKYLYNPSRKPKQNIKADRCLKKCSNYPSKSKETSKETQLIPYQKKKKNYTVQKDLIPSCGHQN